MVRHFLLIALILALVTSVMPESVDFSQFEDALVSFDVTDSDVNPDVDADGENDASENSDSSNDTRDLYGTRTIAGYELAQASIAFGSGRWVPFSDVPKSVLKTPPKSI